MGLDLLVFFGRSSCVLGPNPTNKENILQASGHSIFLNKVNPSLENHNIPFERVGVPMGWAWVGSKLDDIRLQLLCLRHESWPNSRPGNMMNSVSGPNPVINTMLRKNNRKNLSGMYEQSWIRHQEESKELDLRYDKDLGPDPDFKSVYSLSSSWIRCVQGFFPIALDQNQARPTSFTPL